MLSVRRLGLVATSVVVAAACARGQLSSSYPHVYPGLPNAEGDFSDSGAWQRYYEVKDPMPNVMFPLPRSFAGNIPVGRQGLNNTLFFWAFEKTEGSLTADSESNTAPWGIWLNGGPGASSLVGLMLENGPIHMAPDFAAVPNPYSWDRALDMIWVDQPVGVGFSTADADAFVSDEDQVAADFFGFLSNLVQIFPSLATRPLYLTGESYAGVYIPYITKAYFSLKRPPVHLRKLVIGDGAYAPDETDVLTGVVSVLATYPQLIGFDTETFKYFEEQAHLCGLDVNVTYPQLSPIALVELPVPLGGGAMRRRRRLDSLKRLGAESKQNGDISRRAWKKSNKSLPELFSSGSGTINARYGCDLLSEAIDYALNFSDPWRGNTAFDVYDIPDATDPPAPPTPNSPGVFLNDPRVVTAIHAPKKQWMLTFVPGFGYPFGGGNGGDPSVAPTVFFSEFAKNLSEHGIHWALFSGNADLLLPHRGTQIVIQNISFGGGRERGFTRKPGTPWYNDDGSFAGIVHQEYNLTYVLFNNAGHAVSQHAPAAALSFMKRFVLGGDKLGSVLPDGTVRGGERLADDILPAVSEPIFYGSRATQGTKMYASATIAAWNHFTATANAVPTEAGPLEK